MLGVSGVTPGSFTPRLYAYLRLCLYIYIHIHTVELVSTHVYSERFPGHFIGHTRAMWHALCDTIGFEKYRHHRVRCPVVVVVVALIPHCFLSLSFSHPLTFSRSLNDVAPSVGGEWVANVQWHHIVVVVCEQTFVSPPKHSRTHTCMNVVLALGAVFRLVPTSHEEYFLRTFSSIREEL